MVAVMVIVLAMVVTWADDALGCSDTTIVKHGRAGVTSRGPPDDRIVPAGLFGFPCYYIGRSIRGGRVGQGRWGPLTIRPGRVLSSIATRFHAGFEGTPKEPEDGRTCAYVDVSRRSSHHGRDPSWCVVTSLVARHGAPCGSSHWHRW